MAPGPVLEMYWVSVLDRCRRTQPIIGTCVRIMPGSTQIRTAMPGGRSRQHRNDDADGERKTSNLTDRSRLGKGLKITKGAN